MSQFYDIFSRRPNHLAPVVQTLDGAIHRINHYPVDRYYGNQLRYLFLVVQTLDSAIHRIKIYPVHNAIGFPNTSPLDSDLSGG